MVDERRFNVVKDRYKRLLRQVPCRFAKVDCRFYNPYEGDCSALMGLFCEHEDCDFYKKKEVVSL